MAIHIEQDKNQASLAYSLQCRADLDTIRLTTSTVTCSLPLESVEFPLEMALKHQAEDAVVSGNKLSIPIRFGFKAVTVPDKRDVLLVTCRLEAIYELAEGFEPTPEQVDAFRLGNAVFNCWSYFREYVQNCVVRMNYPPVTIPFLRMVPAPSTAEANPVETRQALAQPERPAVEPAKGVLRRKKSKQKI
jgi:hypothetical protein